MNLFSFRRIFSVPMLCLMFLLPAAQLTACEIEVKVKGDRKDAYNEGETIILSVCVFMTHKDCPEGIEATKFKAERLKVLGATKWKETAPLKFERLFKVKVETAEKGECVFHARRTCDKEENGGYGFLKLKAQSVEAAKRRANIPEEQSVD